MKVTFSNVFDTDDVIRRLQEAKIQGLDDFVRSISDMNAKLTMLLRSNVSLSDNVDCAVKVLTMKHDEELEIENPQPLKQVQHLVSTRSLPYKNPITSLAWQYNAKGNINIKAQFLGSPDTSSQVTIVMYF